jgi:hypothetical protein
MEKKQLTKEQIREQMQKLSGISDEKNRLNESKAVTSTNSSTLLSCKRAADGKTYAVIKENHNYFVKVSTLVKDINKYNVYDFAYIGGLSRKMIDECYSSYADATNRLHTKLMVLKEAWTGKADVQEDEIPLNKDVDAKEDPNKEKEGEEVAVDTDTEVAPAEETPATPTEEPSVEPSPILAPSKPLKARMLGIRVERAASPRSPARTTLSSKSLSAPAKSVSIALRSSAGFIPRIPNASL